MKVFISSLIAGFEAERRAVRTAVETLRFQPVMAEDFPAQPNSPQVACLTGLRESDIVVLVLGGRYGAIQPGSDLSATHEEYREARGRKPVIAFVQEGIEAEARQADLIAEVQGWEGGLLRGGFTDPTDLNAGVTRALHDHALASIVGKVDPDELGRRASALLPEEARGMTTDVTLDVAIACGPTQQLLRPIEIESADLADALLQAALFGPDRIFDRASGSETTLAEGALTLRQDRAASFRIDERGTMLIRLPLRDTGRGSAAADAMSRMTSAMVIIEEVVQDRIAAALGYAAATIERVDPTQRISDVAIAARVSGAEYRGWRTRAEVAGSNGSMTMGMNTSPRTPLITVRRRAALRLDRTRLIEDVLVPLRRQFPRA